MILWRETESYEDVSCESGLNRSALGVSEATAARMSQAKVAGPPSVRAPPKSEVRGRLRRKWHEHRISGQIGGQTTSRQGTSQVNTAIFVQAELASTIWGREY